MDLKRFPLLPGVYIFRDGADNTLYIGKARILRNRLASYLRPGASPPTRTLVMLGHAKTVEFIVTNTEKEALILESSLIKKYRPRYNIMLRDDKSYPYLRINMNHPFPRLAITRNRRRDSATYFGPYPSAGAVRETLRFISSVFPLRTCSDHTMKNRERPCLKYQIQKCCAPCCDMIPREEYQEMARQVIMFLSGKRGRLVEILEEKMLDAAEKMEFEKAALFRDQLHAVNRILEKQVMVSAYETSKDVLGLCVDAPYCMVAVIKVRNGVVSGSDTVRMENITNEEMEEIVLSFIKLYYPDLLAASSKGDIPSLIATPWFSEEMKEIQEALTEIAGRVIRICRADRGETKSLARMACQNAMQALRALTDRKEAWKEKSMLIKKVLGLSGRLSVIEGVDISNTGGRESVGSLVVFKNGRPFKEGYRIFNIKGVEGANDYASIHEVVSRRIKTWKKKDEFPDLLLIDGGKGQLGMAQEALSALPIEKRPELASIAKDSSGEGERIYRPAQDAAIMLPAHSPALRLLQHVRDEAHRFGVGTHRKKRLKKGLSSELSSIPGIGDARQRALLQHFGSVSRIRSASIEELRMVRGIPGKTAQSIHEHFHPVE